MLKLYKSVFAAYMITVIAGLIALCVVFRGTNPASSVLLIFLVFVWIFVCAAVFTAIANTKFGKIRVLFRHCRINESLAKYSALYAKCKDYSYNAILIAYYICSCCLALGKPDEAQKYLDKYDLTFLPASKSALRSLWNSAKTELCLQRGDLDKLSPSRKRHCSSAHSAPLCGSHICASWIWASIIWRSHAEKMAQQNISSMS
ncbi:unknown [Candidatus Apopatosoma intestinale]|nr:unknown [Candidatus Apopatosoma intestinale]